MTNSNKKFIIKLIILPSVCCEDSIFKQYKSKTIKPADIRKENKIKNKLLDKSFGTDTPGCLNK